MKLRQLQFFGAVAEELSFSRAAIRLHVAQPSLSTQIKALEDEVGARLFERDKRHVYLTPAGKRFQERVATILSLANTAKMEARFTEAGDLGTIDIGYTALSMFSTALPHAIKRFQQQHANVLITLRELTSLEQLHGLGERTLDLGVLRKLDVSAPAGIRITEWYRTPLVVAIAADHPSARRSSLSLAELKGEAFIMYPREAGTGIYWQVLDLCARAGFRPRVVREVLESSTIIGLVAAGAGIAVVPADMGCIRFAGVEYKNITDPDAYSTLHLAQREGDRNEPLRSLCKLLKSHSPRRKPQA
ncbi:MAG: LysR family transcriptional regulator [Gammaproteobacteria bacterium]|nr:LysR family transcriptional regulator [Gammaproteobacteria bacterium]